MRFSLLATNYLENYQDNGVNPPADSVGSNSGLNGLGTSGPPDWVYRATLAYSGDRISGIVDRARLQRWHVLESLHRVQQRLPGVHRGLSHHQRQLAAGCFLSGRVGRLYKMDWAATRRRNVLQRANLTNKDPGDGAAEARGHRLCAGAGQCVAL